MAVWTNPKTFAALIGLTASELNTYLRDNLTYLKDGLDGAVFNGTQLSRSTNQTLATASAENVVWTTQNFDIGSWWTSGTKIIVPAASIVSGYTTIAVLVYARLKFATNGTGVRRIRFLDNGASFGFKTTPALSGDETDTDMLDFRIVSALDEIEIEGYQSSGGNLAVTEATVSVVRYAPYD